MGIVGRKKKKRKKTLQNKKSYARQEWGRHREKKWIKEKKRNLYRMHQQLIPCLPQDIRKTAVSSQNEFERHAFNARSSHTTVVEFAVILRAALNPRQVPVRFFRTRASQSYDLSLPPHRQLQDKKI